MTVAELIERLKELPPDMLVVKYRDNMNGTWYWESTDGYLLQQVEVVASESGLDVGMYYKPKHNDKRQIIEAVEI